MAPLISVILPVYNQEKYIAATIESVLGQTFGDFELLVHDDGSTDGSAELIRRYAARDARIRASFAPNAGRCAATNALVKQARGQWCALLDADDLMLPERLATQLAYHQAHPEVDATSCHCHYINEHGQHLGTQRYPGLRTAEEGRQALAAGRHVLVAITGLMLSCQAYEQTGGLRNEFWGAEDFEFFNRLLMHGFSLVIIQEVLMEYRVHPNAKTMSNPHESFDMTAYVTYCLSQRQKGQPESSFAEFMALRQHDSWWTKLNRGRNMYSIMVHRQAGFDLHTKNYVGFSWRLVTALLLAPKFTIAAIRKRLNNNSSSADILSS